MWMKDKCDILCKNQLVLSIRSKCNYSNYVILPVLPILQHDIQFGFWMNRTISCVPYNINQLPDFICYNIRRCPLFPNTFKINNLTCFHVKRSNIITFDQIIRLFHTCLTIDTSGNETHCRHSSLFHCPGTSKCISKYRLFDGIDDCYGGADENSTITCHLNQTHRFQCLSENQCISPILVQDQIKHCKHGEDEIVSSMNKFSFQNLCNGYIQMSTDSIYGENETDETNCEQWPCVNQYTRCDGAWTCSNGLDELGCNPLSKCYPDHHECVSPITLKVICLPLNKSGDGKIDCLGATDEREYCRQQELSHPTPYHCWNETRCVSQECFGSLTCSNERKLSVYSACVKNPEIEAVFGSLIGDIILKGSNFLDTTYASDFKYFSLHSSNHVLITNKRSLDSKMIQQTQKSSFDQLEIMYEAKYYRQSWICNRGLLIYSGTELIERCLCPPNYYGDHCQYQSQRVSLTLQFSKECAPYCHGIYGIVMTLQDDNGIIHSYEQLTYISTFNCTMKYNFYFLYRSRSKNLTSSYQIHIDVYNKLNLTYYSSWILPIKFLFLPVNRIAQLLRIPAHPMDIIDNDQFICSDHGRYVRYQNNDKYFCQCDSGWSGRNCTIHNYQCDCSIDSLCLGIVNKRSICLCPLNKIGPRCFLHSICQENPCKNGGSCVPDDDRVSMINFTCICSSGYFGKTCEIEGLRIDISFYHIEIPQLLLFHLITVQSNDHPLINTIWKKISLDEDTTTFYTTTLFNLIFVQIRSEYYLSFLSINFTKLNPIQLQIKPSHYCSHISQLLDLEIVAFPLLRRAKYYHIPCRDQPKLNCFHDNEALMCLCNIDRHANCFNFNFSSKSTCLGQTQCENEGQCVKDFSMCPSLTMCICLDCYYGEKCQFTTKDISLSLDVILAYQIHPKKPITRQRSVIYISIIITTVMLLFSFINSILSAMTFHSKELRKIGCGMYLFTLSIISLLSIVLLNIKLWLFILSQLSWIENRIILEIYCISIDFLSQSLIAIGDWLSACVAIERTIILKEGVNFNKKKSKLIAKWIIIFVIILTMVSFIYDPISRRWINDSEEQRKWCVVQYSSSVRIIGFIVHLIHFLIPFVINLLSAISIIIDTARTHSNSRKKQTYKEHLKEEFHHKKHLIISPIIIIILSIPRLIITFLFGCMKFNRDPWLFLFAYYISFAPSLLTLVVFILPSEVYRNQLDTIIKRKKTSFQVSTLE